MRTYVRTRKHIYGQIKTYFLTMQCVLLLQSNVFWYMRRNKDIYKDTWGAMVIVRDRARADGVAGREGGPIHAVKA